MRRRRAEDPQRFRDTLKRSYAKNRERRLADTRLWKASNPELARASQLISAARKRGVGCSLNCHAIAAAIKAGACQVTGLRFVLTNGKPSPWSPSLDRINGALGYTPENTRVVVWLYNCAKNEFGDADVAILAEAIAAKSAEKIAPAVASAMKK